MSPLPAFVLDLPAGLAVIYVLAFLVWYELLRLAVVSRFARHRGDRARMPAFEREAWEDAELAESERELAEEEAAEASETDPARRLYYLARKSAKAERDLAIQTASEATEQAVERIERRHREIAAELDQEEDERLRRR
jgi:Tfp pilus assembly protein PilX